MFSADHIADEVLGSHMPHESLITFAVLSTTIACSVSMTPASLLGPS